MIKNPGMRSGFLIRENNRELIKENATFEIFFQQASLNRHAHLITGVICGYREEEIEDPLTQQVRYQDKLVDELARGRNGEDLARLGCVCKLSLYSKLNRGDLTNEQWERLAPLLPPQKPRTGRPALDHREVLNGILWVLRTGAPWRDMPDRYSKWTTVYSRFQRWRKSGVWDRIFAEMQTIKDREGLVD
jgi:hypothetical protein